MVLLKILAVSLVFRIVPLVRIVMGSVLIPSYLLLVIGPLVISILRNKGARDNKCRSQGDCFQLYFHQGIFCTGMALAHGRIFPVTITF